MEIVRWIEERHPERPLYPRDEAGRARMLVFVAWFNRVWKLPPNAITGAKPGDARVEGWAAEMRGSLDLFEQMLAGGPYLFGEDFSAADVAAFPFLKYGLFGVEPGDEDPFHAVLVDNLPVAAYPRLTAWVRRVDERPRA
jgi:glutathione S-transferase